uniref:Na+/H+ antiporter NhaA n=1 Tax=Candidatus Electronema sp. TaxID=2698783 RepID=UPI0040575E6B
MNSKPSNFLADFLKMEAAGGILLMAAMVLAIICANSFLNPVYEGIFSAKILGLSVTTWINDGPMAVFFFLVGLELKREFLDGELSDRKKVMLPVFGAIGGMAVPALIYAALNRGDAAAMRGWAIPTATDIAFALGVLSLLGSRVPSSLKVFLTTLAIFDDLGAVLIIAFFYTANISFLALALAGICVLALAGLNWMHVGKKTPYIAVGLLLWLATLKSGVHATVAGVVLAMFIPLSVKGQPGLSPLKSLEHSLHSVVAFIILPLFAFANSGLNLRGMGAEQLLHPVPVGVALGLFVGKQIGVFSLCFAAVKLKIAELPKSADWMGLYGVALLCGIGFTMSLFIGSLAFQGGSAAGFDERLGIIAGSLLSGLAGYLLLYFTAKQKA